MEKKNMIIIAAVFCVFLIIGLVIYGEEIVENTKVAFAEWLEEFDDSMEESTNPEITPSNPTTARPLSKEEKFVEKMVKGGGDEQTAKNIYSFLENELLCSDISFDKKAAIGNAMWEIDASGYHLQVSAYADDVYYVKCGDYNMFEDGVVKYTVNDLDDRNIGNNKVHYAAIAENIISGNLKAPTTAKFPQISEYSMQRNKNLVAVSGYVDAQNSFGAMIRSNWVVEFEVTDLDSLSFNVVYVNIDNQQVGEFIELD